MIQGYLELPNEVLGTILNVLRSQCSSRPAKKQKTQDSESGKGTSGRTAESGCTRTKQLEYAFQTIQDYENGNDCIPCTVVVSIRFVCVTSHKLLCARLITQLHDRPQVWHCIT